MLPLGTLPALPPTMQTVNLRTPRNARQFTAVRVTPIAGYAVVAGVIAAPAPRAAMSPAVRRKFAIAAACVMPCVSTALRTMVATRANLSALYRK